MSDAMDPVGAAFDRGGRALALTHRAARDATDLQREAVRAFAKSIDDQRAVGERSTEAAGSAVETSLLLTRSWLPGGESAVGGLQRQFEDGLDAAEDAQRAGWDVFARSVVEGAEVYDRYVDLYLDAVDASFEMARVGNDWMNEQAAGTGRPRGTPVEIDIEGES